ncbi:ABC transporter substrate-binding protein [Niveibacterium terrae]|uniref:ABC transporter substrate-binding protein n=1 Tax=Niveibacterium terrae TaxID=3373598 RepID=UPI003A946532
MRRLLLLCCLFLLACGPQKPVRLGFIGGTSGRFADLGTSGRNGAQLAVEMRNLRGGVRGHPVELLLRDDKQDATVARKALVELKEAGALAVIGPMTSSMALSIIPKANEQELVLMSGTVSTSQLSGKDDYFFRVIGDTARAAAANALFHARRLGYRRATLIWDIANRDYSEVWASEYSRSFTSQGGQILQQTRFDSHQDKNYAELARTLLAPAPQIVVLVCNSVDAALLAQQLRRQDGKVRIAGAGWASTERIIELGGRAVEGMLLEQFFDRQDSSPRYQSFVSAYRKRFSQEPGFAGVTSFDAANVLMDALEKNPDPTQLKKTLLAMRNFPGVQSTVSFDAYGDAVRPSHMAEVKDGVFSPLQ